MWINFGNMLLNTDTGAKFCVRSFNDFGNEITPELVHEAPAGGVIFEGFPMGATIRTTIKIYTDTTEIEQDFYELSQTLDATHTNISGDLSGLSVLE